MDLGLEHSHQHPGKEAMRAFERESLEMLLWLGL